MEKRNQEILAALEADYMPALPFELEIAKNALDRHINEQKELGQKLREAMEQSSETWHDNAPAESVTASSKILANIAEKNISIINQSIVFDYEEEASGFITLGSIFDLENKSRDRIDRYMLTGASSELPSELRGSGIKPISMASPIGKLAFDKQVNDEFSFISPSGQIMDFRILEITTVGNYYVENS